MYCPNCPEERLLMTERNGVEIDYCPKCRGVWLDRGELDKLLERATELALAEAPPRQAAPAPTVVVAPTPPRADDRRYEERRYEEPRYAERKPYKEHKRYDDDSKYKNQKSLLSEIFDF